MARALDCLGERWTLLIVRDLLLGPRRYGDLLRGLPGMTANMLAIRMRGLEDDGLVEKHRLPPPAPSVVYRLTAAGLALEPVLDALGQWGEQRLEAPRHEHLDVAWLLPRLRRRYRGGYHLLLELVEGERRFSVELQPHRLAVTERPAPEAELVLSGSSRALHDLFLGPSASEVLARGEVTAHGRVGRWPKLMAAFGLR